MVVYFRLVENLDLSVASWKVQFSLYCCDNHWIKGEVSQIGIIQQPFTTFSKSLLSYNSRFSSFRFLSRSVLPLVFIVSEALCCQSLVL